MLLIILFGIIAYVAGDEYFTVFKYIMAAGFVIYVCNAISASAPKREARRTARMRRRAVKQARERYSLLEQWREECRRMAEEAEDFEAEFEEEEIEIEEAAPAPVRYDAEDIEYKELTIAQLQKRLNVLYTRMDRMHSINGATPEEWERWKKTKSYRGLEWDINDTEERLERAINTEKAKWESA